jgi:hypothetical protein
VNQFHQGARQAVASRKSASRFQYAPNFSKHPILQLRRMYVMQHREHHHSGESLIGNWHRSGIAGDNFDVGGSQP